MERGIITDASGVLWYDAFADISRYAKMFGADAEKLGDAKNRLWVERFSIDPEMSYREFWREIFSEAGIHLSEEEIEYVNSDLLDSHYPHDSIFSFFRLVRESGKFRTVMLTNSSRDWLDYWREKYGLDTMFDSIVAPYSHGVRKPGKEIWEVAIRETGLPPRYLAAVEDQESNLKGAVEAGIPEKNCILFKDPSQGLHELIEFVGGYEREAEGTGAFRE